MSEKAEKQTNTIQLKRSPLSSYLHNVKIDLDIIMQPSMLERGFNEEGNSVIMMTGAWMYIDQETARIAIA